MPPTRGGAPDRDATRTALQQAVRLMKSSSSGAPVRGNRMKLSHAGHVLTSAIAARSLEETWRSSQVFAGKRAA
jgi:hypothetical protein